MEYRDDRYEMTVGETNKLTIDLAPTCGPATLEAFTITADGLTFTTPSLTDRGATTFVSGGAEGEYIATTTATLSDTQVKVGSVILEWKTPGFEYRGRRH